MWGNVFCLLTLGGLFFFPAVVAPTVFKALPETEAGQFLRALFPRYYLFLIIGSAAAALAYGRAALEPALLAAGVSVSTAAVLFFLVPKINALRDQQLAGDSAAGNAFTRAHRLSVAINFVQLGALVLAVAR